MRYISATHPLKLFNGPGKSDHPKEYAKKQRMGLWTGSTEKRLHLFYVDGDKIALPCGTGKQIRKLLSGAEFHQDLADNGELSFLKRCMNIRRRR